MIQSAMTTVHSLGGKDPEDPDGAIVGSRSGYEALDAGPVVDMKGPVADLLRIPRERRAVPQRVDRRGLQSVTDGGRETKRERTHDSDSLVTSCKAAGTAMGRTGVTRPRSVREGNRLAKGEAMKHEIRVAAGDGIRVAAASGW